MRTLVLLLALANVVLFAYRDYIANQDAAAAPALAQQIQPHRIRLLSAEELALRPETAKACLELGPLDHEALGRVKDALSSVAGTARLGERGSEPAFYAQVRGASDALHKRLLEVAAIEADARLAPCPL